MAIKPDYKAGTASIANGATTITFAGGANLTAANIAPGDTFKVQNLDAVIVTVTDSTHAEIAEPWTGTVLVAAPYRIRYQPDGSKYTAAARDLIDQLGNGNLQAFAALAGAFDYLPIFTGTGALTLIAKRDLIQGVQTNAKVSNLAGRAAYDGAVAGFSVLVADVGDGRSAIYFKNTVASGDWSPPAYLTGPNGSFQSKGAYNNATAYVIGDVVLQNGSSWIARVNTTGNLPPALPATSNTQWFLLSAAGNGFVFRGDYAGATAYLKDDVVLYNNSSWIALQPTTGNTPPALPATSNAYWSLIAAKGAGDVSGPASSVAGNIAVFSGTTGKVLADSGVPAKTALRQNLIVNPAMQISQENDVTASGAAGFYAADQWFDAFVTSTGVVSFGRVVSRTPRGSKYRLRLSVTTADTSIAAGEVIYVGQHIEGARLANLGWNGTIGTQLVCRFGFRGPAGTYSFSYRNGAATRAWVSNFTVSPGQANTDIEITKVIPADNTGGAWPDTTVLGADLSIALMSGSTYVTTPDIWQTGNFVAGTGISNGLATVGNTFELFDIGLYPDPNNAGVAPDWIAPKFNDDERDALRYWSRFTVIVNTASDYIATTLPVAMRVAPTISGGGAGFAVAAPGNITTTVFQTTRAGIVLTFSARM